MDSTEHIFSDLKILKFIDINLYLTVRFMYKFLRGGVPGVFNKFFHRNNAVHNYFTRQSEYLHVPLEKSNLSQFCIRYRGVTVWNAILKSTINSNCSEHVFSKSLKSSLRYILIVMCCAIPSIAL